MTDPSAWRTTTYDAGTRRWVENMSATGRRQATSVAASKLRQWVNRTLDERPTRGELRAWVLLVLDERRALHNKAEGLAKENDAVDDQRDTLVEALAAMKVERDALTAQRDAALEDLAAERAAHDADVAELGDHRDTLRGMLRQAQCERDRLRAELREARKGHAETWKVGRASCSCTTGGGAE